VDFDNLPPEITSADISIAREFLCSTCISPRCPFLGAYITMYRAVYLTAWMPSRHGIEARH
jgi:hypothetical protein